MPSASARPGLLEKITQHDILNQLAVVRGHLSLALSGLPEGPLRGHIAAGLLAVDNIVGQIDFIRDCQEIGTNGPFWQDVEALFRRAALALDLRGAVLRVDVKGLEVLADPLLAKVVYNLVDNAVTHGGKVSVIAVAYEEREGGLDLVCSDNGEGIPEEVKQGLFQRNFNRHAGRGLYLSKEILAKDGMSISETGAPGRGARFVIAIPAGRHRFPGHAPTSDRG